MPLSPSSSSCRVTVSIAQYCQPVESLHLGEPSCPSIWAESADDERHLAWVKDLTEARQPSTRGGVYLNFSRRGPGQAGYGSGEYRELVELKGKHDPDNLFRLNQNISP
jgi:hypothetical protein